MAQNFDAIVFDLDGVITKTATVHSKAWKQTFDEFLKELGHTEEFTERDYKCYVDGKPREDGVRSFLESRGITLPLGEMNDAGDLRTIYGVGNRKNDVLLKVLEAGIEVFETTVRLMRECKQNGLKVGVASSSKNCQAVLEACGLTPLVDARVDGVTSTERKLRGKPAPDIFVECTRDLGTVPSRTIVFEDAISGVRAGRAGQFALVVGLARENNIDELKENGADVAFQDWGDFTLADLDQWIADKGANATTTGAVAANGQPLTAGEKALLKGADTGAAALSTVSSPEINRSI